MTFLPSIGVLTSVYHGEEYLPKFFQNLQNQTLFPELELILVLNDPSSIEKKIVKDFQIGMPGQIKVLFVETRETLSASWNKAWKVSKAPYLTMWNIDDRRLIDSLQRQLSALEQNPDWMLCYGDYISVSEYGTEQGIQRHTPKYQRAHFRRAFAQGGAFWLFRRQIHEIAGYFDEQFSVGSDLELSLRMATIGLEMGKCEGVLGYFTNAAAGLSTRNGAQLSEVERTAIQLRYGVFDKVNRELLTKTKPYRVEAILQAGSWEPLTNYLPNIEVFVQRRRILWIIGYIRNKLRSLAKHLGLLRLIHNAQDRFLKREI